MTELKERSRWSKIISKSGVRFRRFTSLAKRKLNNAKESKEDESVSEARLILINTRSQIENIAKIVNKLYKSKKNEYKYINILSNKLLQISPSTNQPKMIKGTKIKRDKWLNFINLIGETQSNMDTPYEILLQGILLYLYIHCIWYILWVYSM